MKILITSEGSDIDQKVDARFGRARQFAVVDLESNEIVFVENTQNLNAPQGAGIQSAQTAARLGVGAVLTGNVGPKAFATLDAADIKVYTGISGTIREAIEQFKTGELQGADSANVEGHWT